MRGVCLLVSLFLSASPAPAALAQPAAPLAGHSARKIGVPAQPLTVVVALSSRVPGRGAGTLTLPADAAPPFPAILLIPGSVSQDRDETTFSRKPFLLIADQLVRKGVAVFRLHDRGVGASTDSPETLTSLDLADDVDAGLAYLKSRTDIDSQRLGLLGHGEGGLIAAIVASRLNDVAFLVLLAGNAVPGEQLLYSEGEASLKAVGAGAEAVAAQRRQQERLFAIARRDLPNPEATANARAALRAEIVSLLPAGSRDSSEAKAQVETMVDALLSPWFRFFLTYDPARALESVKCPVLALNGDKDTRVPGRLNLDAIRAALARGGNKNLESHELPGLNHLFRTVSRGSPADYRDIEETMSPTALILIVEWVTRRAASSRHTSADRVAVRYRVSSIGFMSHEQDCEVFPKW